MRQVQQREEVFQDTVKRTLSRNMAGLILPLF